MQESEGAALEVVRLRASQTLASPTNLILNPGDAPTVAVTLPTPPPAPPPTPPDEAEGEEPKN